MKIPFERLVSRSVVRFLSSELDLAGVKMTVERLIEICILGGMGILIFISFALTILAKINPGFAVLAGIAVAAFFEMSIYAVLELKIDQRRSFVENILPDYLQLTAANIRSGISLDKAMLAAARPEFSYFSADVVLVNKQLYVGETIQNALFMLAKKYRSLELQHLMRMMVEAIQYGGGMTDLLNQIARDMRQQHTIQKEVSGQLFMYTIFIAFAALIGAPVMYALTTSMITITDTVWAGIQKQGGLNQTTTGVSFLKPTPPQIKPQQYRDFALAAVLMIAGMASFVVSVITSGSVLKGIRYLPFFIIVGLGVYIIASFFVNGIFTSIGGV